MTGLWRRSLVGRQANNLAGEPVIEVVGLAHTRQILSEATFMPPLAANKKPRGDNSRAAIDRGDGTD